MLVHVHELPRFHCKKYAIKLGNFSLKKKLSCYYLLCCYFLTYKIVTKTKTVVFIRWLNKFLHVSVKKESRNLYPDYFMETILVDFISLNLVLF